MIEVGHFDAFALSGRMLRVRYTQGAASLCPGLIAGCPYRALPTESRIPQVAKLMDIGWGNGFIDGYRLAETGCRPSMRSAQGKA